MTLANFLAGFESASLWTRAIGARRAGMVSESIKLIEVMSTKKPLKPHHLAYLATNHVLVNDTDKARDNFRMACESTKGISSPDEKYVNIYSRAFLRMIDEDIRIDDLIEEADHVRCRQAIKRWLPLHPRS